MVAEHAGIHHDGATRLCGGALSPSTGERTRWFRTRAGTTPLPRPREGAGEEGYLRIRIYRTCIHVNLSLLCTILYRTRIVDGLGRQSWRRSSSRSSSRGKHLIVEWAEARQYQGDGVGHLARSGHGSRHQDGRCHNQGGDEEVTIHLGLPVACGRGHRRRARPRDRTHERYHRG